MTKICYIPWNPQGKTRKLIAHADDIINEYSEMGYILTLRQLYYQFVARDIIPNTERSYKNIVNMMTRARNAGLISWRAIEDRNRGMKGHYIEESTQRVVEQTPAMIQHDRWGWQDYYLEVWVEKEALGNVVERACKPWMVNHLSCKGYLSVSEAWRAGQRIQQRLSEGKKCVIIHLGDHDPSGIDMTRDNQDRVDLYSEEMYGAEVRRIALNMDQIKQYSPPPNPAKLTDSRAKEYIRHHGRTSWELDALEPKVIEDLIVDEIKSYINWDNWNMVTEEQRANRKILSTLANNWESIREDIEMGRYDED